MPISSREFAERLIQANQVGAFIQALILQLGVQPDAILCAVKLAEQAKAKGISNPWPGGPTPSAN